jgi:hypothetical protein
MEIPSTVPHVLEVPMAVVLAGDVVVVCAKLSVEKAKAVITNECFNVFFNVFFMRFIFLLFVTSFGMRDAGINIVCWITQRRKFFLRFMVLRCESLRSGNLFFQR